MAKIEPGGNDIEITEDNALTVLVDILGHAAIWKKDPNVKVCCKFIGAKIIGLETKVSDAVTILKATKAPY